MGTFSSALSRAENDGAETTDMTPAVGRNGRPRNERHTMAHTTFQIGIGYTLTMYRDDMSADELLAHAAMLSSDHDGAPVDVFVGLKLRYDGVVGPTGEPTPITDPAVHVADDIDSDDAYGWTQTDDSIRDGDVLVCETRHGRVVGFMSGAWPVAMHGADAAIAATGWHTLADDADIRSLGRSHGRLYDGRADHWAAVPARNGHDYTASVAAAAAYASDAHADRVPLTSALETAAHAVETVFAPMGIAATLRADAIVAAADAMTAAGSDDSDPCRGCGYRYSCRCDDMRTPGVVAVLDAVRRTGRSAHPRAGEAVSPLVLSVAIARGDNPSALQAEVKAYADMMDARAGL